MRGSNVKQTFTVRFEQDGDQRNDDVTTMIRRRIPTKKKKIAKHYIKKDILFDF